MARDSRFAARCLRTLAGGLLVALSLAVSAPAVAQTTSGNAGTGATLFAANCNVGCHGATPLAVFASTANAANAGGHIEWSRTNGMPAPALTGQQFNDIAAYIAQSVPDPNPVAVSVPFNATAPGTASAPIPIPNIALGTLYGQFDANLQFISAGKGTVTFAGTNATYRANACQTGSDTATFRATRAGGASNTRSFTVSIANPVSGPVFTSPTVANATTGTPFTYNATVSSCSSLVTWGLTGAPGWLSIDGAGVVSGTPPFGTQGTSPAFTVNATYPGGASSSRIVTLTIALGPPTVNSAATAPPGTVGVAYPGYQIQATNGPPFTNFSAAGLPPGLTVDIASGLVTGTPLAAGVFVAAVTASNTAGSSAPLNVTFNIAVASPVVNSPPTASGQTGVPFSYQITATNGPPFTGFTAAPLPAGLSVDTATGLISGIPGTIGTTNVTVTASNASGASPPFALTITIGLGPPAITSATTASGGVAVPFSYQITATNSPTSFGATGLPAGLSVNATTGLISGTPAVAGTFPVTISATNAVPLMGSATLTLTIATVAPVITSPTSASGQTGVPFSYQITAANGPTSFGATGLPPGLTLDTATGLISGTPTTTGVFIATLSAANGAGNFSQATTFTISLGAPAITSPSTASGAATLPFTYQITATNNPTSFAATGLPPGLAVNTATGLVSGTPSANGSFVVTLAATNAAGTGTLALTITLAVGPPVINSPVTASGATDKPFSYQITATGSPSAYGASGLPPGLAVNTASGLISGVPTAAGTFAVNLTATNATGTGTLALTITIGLSAPTITSPATASATTGQPFSYQVTGTGGPASYAATGLPPGLTINAATGLISGTPSAGGTYAVTVSATNSAGTGTQVLTITIAFVAPSVRDLAVEVAFQQPTPIALPVTGQFTRVNIVSPPANGTLAPIPAGSATVTYTSATGYSGGDSFTYSATGPGGTSGVATVTISVPTFRPVAGAAAMAVPLNTPTRLDLAPFITGSGVTGVSITTAPRHGSVAVDGKSVTYAPKADYFGDDAFEYIAFGNAGRSEPGKVTVNIVGRPDPSKDPTVVGLVEAQASAARRFARAQVANYQRRLETLHAPPPAAATAASGDAAAPPAAGDGAAAGKTAASPATGATEAAVAGALASAASSQSVNLASVSSGANGGAGAADGINLWAGGVATFGKRSLEEEGTSLRFSSDGLTVGADRRVNDRLALGLGLGYARDETDIGSQGSRSSADGVSLAGYGSYRPTRETFVDAVLGFGSLDFDSDRHVAAFDAFATGRRKGRQVFGAIAAGYEMRREGVLLSPYGRLDFAYDRLDQATESGAGVAALSFHEQSLQSVQAAAGLRLESRHATDFGWAQPRLRLEYRHEFEDAAAATVSYADGFEGRTYSVTPSGASRNFLLLGVGVDFLLRRGLRFGVEYLGERADGPGTTQSLRFTLAQDLDAPGRPAWGWGWTMLEDAVNVEAGFGYDDNVSRGRLAQESFSDQVYSLGLNASRTFPINDNVRAIATGLFNVDKFHDNTGLGRTSGGLQGELQYRASGEFTAPTVGLFARGWVDGYESRLRSGSRYSLGLNVRRSLTDRLDLFGEAAANWRRAESEVFEGRDYSAKLNLDYGLGRSGTAYLAGEYRRGDTFSSGFGSLWNLNVAEVFVPDDAFDRSDVFAYRFEGRTLLGTIGYNRPLGPRDAIDFSYRRVQTTPSTPPEGPGPSSYTVNQYSIIYLLRF